MKRLIVEPPLTLDEAAAWATDDERAIADGFAPARAHEYLAWRAVVRREIGRDADIAYTAAGAPVLTNYPLHISVAHCRGGAADARERFDRAGRTDCRDRCNETGRTTDSRGWFDETGRVAVAISDAPCGVDIEPVARDFRRAVPRYLSPAEQRLSAHPLFPAIAWCAKETLFKYAASATGHSLDLLRDLHIDRVQFSDGNSGTLCAHLLNEEPIALHFHEAEGFAVVSLFE